MNRRRNNPFKTRPHITSPIPSQVISNEEFQPPPQTETQARVERLIYSASNHLSHHLGIDRREFLRSTGGWL